LPPRGDPSARVKKIEYFPCGPSDQTAVNALRDKVEFTGQPSRRADNVKQKELAVAPIANTDTNQVSLLKYRKTTEGIAVNVVQAG
jgi:hypothetical protein